MKKLLRDPDKCPVKKSIDVLGGKWRLLIISVLREGKLRYGEIKRNIPEITEKMLIQELRKLEDYKLIKRKTYNTIPPKVEYSLTEKGFSVMPILQQLVKFGEDYVKE